MELTEGCYQNPILRGDFPDPTVLRVGKDYYMTHSSGRYRPGLLLWHSQNLVDWEPVCFACGNLKGDIWAPDLSFYQGRYYIYFTVLGSNFVVTADSIEGPWSTPVDLGIGGIDPCHCTDDEGNRYLFLSGGSLVPLSQDGLSIGGTVKKVYDGWQYPEEWHTEGLCLEAPKIIRKGRYYYLTVAEGGTAGPATAHMVVSARSESLFGPWENSPYNPIVHCSGREETWRNRGHGTLLDDADGNWWLVYHAYEKDYLTLGRRTLLEPVEWTDDGWFRVPQNVRPDASLPCPTGKRVTSSISLSDPFTAPGPLPQWRFLGCYDASRYTYTGNGVLVAGKGVLPDAGSSAGMGALVGSSNPMACTAWDQAYEVSCTVTLQGNAEGGLLLFYNESFFCGMGLCSGKIHFYRSGKFCGSEKVSCTKMRLKLVNDHNDLLFFYSKDGSSWERSELSMDVSGYHHNTLGGYLSLRPALYSVGTGNVLFQSFLYQA